MAFVPLSPESKLVGKAVIDGVCSRFGKSGGSIVLQTLFLFFSSLSASSPYVAVVLLGVLGIWIVTLRVLGHKFNQLTIDSKEVLVPLEGNETEVHITPPVAVLPAALLKEQQAV